MRIRTNNVPRELVSWTELSKREKKRFQVCMDKYNNRVLFFYYKDKLHCFNTYAKTELLNGEGFVDLFLSGWTHANNETRMCIKLLDNKRIIIGHY
jgi:hypothetical protein